MREPSVDDGADRRLLERIKQDLRLGWRAGQPRALEDYLREYPSLAGQADLLMELIYTEVLLREQNGEVPRPEDYCQRFPHLADEVALQFQAHEALGPPDELTPVQIAPPGSTPCALGEAIPADVAQAPAIAGYDVLDKLGEGGMGVVYKARQTTLKRLVALKLVLEGEEASPDELFLFQREAEALGRMKHPNVVQVYDYGEHGGQPYMAMELVEGSTLEEQLKRGPWESRRAAALVETLARGVQAAHTHGLVHRDLKPSNVLLTADGTPKISDFGLARHVPRESSFGGRGAAEGGRAGLSHNRLLGTPAYMAPEQAHLRYEAIGPATDVYALGGILYEMLTGRPPQPGNWPALLLFLQRRQREAPSAVRRGLDRDIESICLKCLDWDGGRRYASALELAEDLARYGRGEPVEARPIGSPERAVKWARRRPALAALLLVSLLGVAGMTWKYADAESHRAKAERAEGAAKDEARRAEQEEGRAKLAEQAAKTEEASAKRELARAEGLLYRGNLLQAQLLQESGNAGPAMDRLDACRWDYRGWEHAHLRHELAETCLTLRGHARHVTGVAFSPDGKYLASAGANLLNRDEPGEVKVWDTVTGRELFTLRGHNKGAFSVAFSPDGKRLASGSQDQTVKVWDMADGRELLTLKGPALPVNGVAFSPDGSRLAGGYGEHDKPGEVTVWDAVSGLDLLTLKGHANSVNSVAFSPDGKRLASGAWDMTVKVWDATGGQELLALKGITDGVSAVAFSPDGKRLVGSSGNTTVKVWDATGGQELLTLKGQAQVTGVAFSPDGKRIACGGWNRNNTGDVKVWDASGGEELFSLRGHAGVVSCVAFSPDSKLLASGSADVWNSENRGEVKVWDATGGPEQVGFKVRSGVIYGVAFSPDGKRIAAGSAVTAGSAGVIVWDAAGGQELLALKGHTEEVSSVAFSPDGKRLASASYDQTVRVWDAADGRELLILKGHTQAVDGVCFSPDGQRLASAGDDTVRVWDAAGGKELLALKGHTKKVWTVAISPDGERIASAGRDQTVRLWDAAGGKELLTLKGHTDDVCGVAFSPDGRRLASASQDQTVKVWDAASGRELLTLTGHTLQVWSVAFSPDGKRLASGSYDTTVKVWDAVAGGEALLTLGDPTFPVTSVRFSADGQRLAAGGVTKPGRPAVKVWETASGREVFLLRGHTGLVTGVSFSPDGLRIVSRDDRGEVRSWDAVTGQPFDPCTDPAPENERDVLSPNGSLRATADGSAVRVVRTADRRPPSDEVVLGRLNDPAAVRGWHRREADESEQAGRWFAAAFHLRRLIVAGAADADQLRERLKRCDERLRQP
jgi:WD40 repeat protein